MSTNQPADRSSTNDDTQEKEANIVAAEQNNTEQNDAGQAEAGQASKNHEPRDDEDVTADELEIIKTALATAEKKANDNWALYLAARAEADNSKKRALRDVDNARKFALEKFIPELLGIKDSLELGIKAAHDNLDKASNEQVKNFIAGSEMTLSMFSETLKKHHVETIEPIDEVLNPELHQAISMVANDELAVNTVTEVIQKGYTLNGRLLRPAMVVVSKKS